MIADECETVLRHLVDAGPLTIDDLIGRLDLPMWRVNELLTHLLLAGRVRPAPGRRKNRKVTTYEPRVK